MPVPDRVLLAPVVVGLVLLVLPACSRPPVIIAQPPVPATPDPHEEALVDRTVRERLAEENRVTEQQLANRRAAASQRRVGREMFLDLEAQYRQRQAETSGSPGAGPTDGAAAEPLKEPDPAAFPGGPAPRKRGH